jgi:phenylacetate-CoA ligase
MFWNQEIETIDRHALEQLQLKRLITTLRRLAKHVPYYHQKMVEADLEPKAIQSFKDLRQVKKRGQTITIA